MPQASLKTEHTKPQVANSSVRKSLLDLALDKIPLLVFNPNNILPTLHVLGTMLPNIVSETSRVSTFETILQNISTAAHDSFRADNKDKVQNFFEQKNVWNSISDLSVFYYKEEDTIFKEKKESLCAAIEKFRNAFFQLLLEPMSAPSTLLSYDKKLYFQTRAEVLNANLASLLERGGIILSDKEEKGQTIQAKYLVNLVNYDCALQQLLDIGGEQTVALFEKNRTQVYLDQTQKIYTRFVSDGKFNEVNIPIVVYQTRKSVEMTISYQSRSIDDSHPFRVKLLKDISLWQLPDNIPTYAKQISNEFIQARTEFIEKLLKNLSKDDLNRTLVSDEAFYMLAHGNREVAKIFLSNRPNILKELESKESQSLIFKQALMTLHQVYFVYDDIVVGKDTRRLEALCKMFENILQDGPLELTELSQARALYTLSLFSNNTDEISKENSQLRAKVLNVYIEKSFNYLKVHFAFVSQPYTVGDTINYFILKCILLGDEKTYKDFRVDGFHPQTFAELQRHSLKEALEDIIKTYEQKIQAWELVEAQKVHRLSEKIKEQISKLSPEQMESLSKFLDKIEEEEVITLSQGEAMEMKEKDVQPTGETMDLA